MPIPVIWSNPSLFPGDQFAALPDGSVVAVWSGLDGVRRQIMNADGTPRGSALRIDGTNDPNQKGEKVAVLEDGRFVVTWNDTYRVDGVWASDIKARMFNVDGSPAGDVFQVNRARTVGEQSEPTISALKGGGFVIGYKDGSGTATDTIVQAFDGNGARVGPEFAASNGTANREQAPEVVGLQNDNYVFLYSDSGSTGAIVRGVIRTPEGQIAPGTAPFTVPEGGVGSNQTQLSATLLADGRFVVVWESTNIPGPDTSDSGIYAQVFNSNGSRSGAQILVNTTVDGYQRNPLVTALQNGGFAVAFEDKQNDVRLRTFNSNGVPDSDDFLVHPQGTDRQFLAGLSCTKDGRIIVTWGQGIPVKTWGAIFDPRTTGVSIDGTVMADQYYGGIGNDVLSGRGGEDRLHGGEGGDILNGGVGNDMLEGGAGNDTLEGGSGTDTAVFSGKQIDYTINGDGKSATVRHNDGTDTDALKDVRLLRFADKLVVLSNVAPKDLQLSKASIAENAPGNAEVGKLSATDADGDALTYSLAPGSSGSFGIIGNSLVVTGPLDFETKPVHQLTIQASDGLGGVTSLNVNVTVTNAVEKTPFTIRGTPRADVLSGEAGNDTIYGSGGNDRLTGGAGKDVFVFDTKLNKRTNVDRIMDFRYQDDSIWLDNKYFTKLGSGSFTKPKKFKSDMFTEGKKAQDAEDRIVYDKKTGALYYDQDGTGSKAQVKIATITNKTKMTYQDFFVI